MKGSNFRVDGNKVISYTTHVATIDGNKLLVHGWWSQTTSRHINKVAKFYGLTKVDQKKGEEDDKKATGYLNTVAAIASLANLGNAFAGESKKAKNDWKLRMIKAGMESKGLSVPEDWDSLSEDEKEKRLNGVIEVLKEK